MALALGADVKFTVCILTVMFGIGTWLATNAAFMELPILVRELPEGWNLPSYMAAVVQIANIGPIIITSCNMFFKKTLPETCIITVMFLTGSLALLCMAFLWTRTSFIAGAEHSTALLALLFVFALVDCSSAVVFLPFMNKFKPRYITLFYVGSGLSGMVTSVVALLQGVGQVDCVTVAVENVSTNITDYLIKSVYVSPKFPVRDFFIMYFVLMVMCTVAFLLLNNWSYCKTEHAEVEAGKTVERLSDTVSEKNLETEIKSSVYEHSKNYVQVNLVNLNQEYIVKDFRYRYYLLLIGLTSALANGVLPSVQSYAALPYGFQSYHLSVTLSNIANPIGCFLVLFLPVTSSTVISVLTVIGGGCSMYILALAVLSPVPPMVEAMAGSVLVVSAFVIVYFLLSFTKVTLASYFRKRGKQALFWCGAVTQLGSALGTAAMFVAINVYHVFTQKYPCT